MKITKRQLRKIIKEEKAKLMEQPDIPDVMGAIGHGKFQPREEFEGSMMDLDDYEEFSEAVNAMVSSYAKASGYTREDLVEALQTIIGEM